MDAALPPGSPVESYYIMALVVAYKLKRGPKRLCWGKNKTKDLHPQQRCACRTQFPQRRWAHVIMFPAGPVVARGNRPTPNTAPRKEAPNATLSTQVSLLWHLTQLSRRRWACFGTKRSAHDAGEPALDT